jgi:hypothetical protein
MFTMPCFFVIFYITRNALQLFYVLCARSRQTNAQKYTAESVEK